MKDLSDNHDKNKKSIEDEELNLPVEEDSDELEENEKDSPKNKVIKDETNEYDNEVPLESEEVKDAVKKEDEDMDPLDNEAETDDEEKSEEDEIEKEDSKVDEKPKETFNRESGPKINFDYQPSKHDQENDNEEEIEEAEPAIYNNQRKETLNDLASEPEKVQEYERRSVNRTEKPVSERLNEEEDEFNIPRVRSNVTRNNPSQYDEVDRSGINRGDRNKFFPYDAKPKRGFNKFYLLLLIILGVGVLVAAFYFLKNSPQSIELDNNIAVSSPTPTETATPSPEALISRSDYTIRVLNGTSTSGLAASVSAQLNELGYKTDKVGNATNSAFTRTVVRVKKNSPAGLVDQLIKDLLPKYDATPSTDLKIADSVDAELILGTR